MPTTGTRSRAAVIGLGYVGVPLSLLFVRKGWDVTGIDIDGDRVSALNHYHSYLSDVSAEDLRSAGASGRFRATTDFSVVRQADVIVLCVPTPLNDDFEPDLRCLRDAAHSVRLHLRPGQLVVLESTTYPGTTEEVLVPLLTDDPAKVGREVFIGYSPERINPVSLRKSRPFLRWSAV